MAGNPLESWAAWSRGERNLVGGLFEGVLGQPLTERGFFGAVGQSFGAGTRMGATGLWKMAQFGGLAAFTGGANLATAAWNTVPGASPTWWRRRQTTTLNRQIADKGYTTALASRYQELHGSPLTRANATQIGKSYGRAGEGLHAFGGARPFGQRGVRGHLWQGGKTYLRHGLMSPLSLGLNLGFSLYDSDNNLLDPKSGMAKHMLGFMGMEAGFMLGGTVGAAAASAMVPTGGALLAGAGYILGAVAGSLALGYVF